MHPTPAAASPASERHHSAPKTAAMTRPHDTLEVLHARHSMHRAAHRELVARQPQAEQAGEGEVPWQLPGKQLVSQVQRLQLGQLRSSPQHGPNVPCTVCK